MKKYGVNRLSFGVQAAQDNLLKKIGRIHSFEEFKENIYKAREIGFTNINADIMFGLPNQSISDWENTIKTMAELNLEHISAYSLIIEEGTAFIKMLDKGLLTLPNEDEERAMYNIVKDILKSYGYHQYEISNYSKEGYESLHNKTYWQCNQYIGLGSSASSFVDNERYSNETDIEEYIKKINKDVDSVKIDIHTNSDEDSIEEFMFMGLRMIVGINKEEFKRRFNKDIYEIYDSVIEKNKSLGLLLEDEKSIYLSQKGIELSNGVMSDFILT